MCNWERRKPPTKVVKKSPKKPSTSEPKSEPSELVGTRRKRENEEDERIANLRGRRRYWSARIPRRPTQHFLRFQPINT